MLRHHSHCTSFDLVFVAWISHLFGFKKLFYFVINQEKLKPPFLLLMTIRMYLQTPSMSTITYKFIVLRAARRFLNGLLGAIVGVEC